MAENKYLKGTDWKTAVDAKMREHEADGFVLPTPPTLLSRPMKVPAVFGDSVFSTGAEMVPACWDPPAAIPAPTPKPTRWQDGALAEEHMRAPTEAEVQAAIRHKADMSLPFYGRVRVLDSEWNGARRCIIAETSGAHGCGGVQIGELRVPRMPETGSRWTDGRHTHVVLAHLHDYRVESLVVEANDVCEHGIEDWYAGFKPVAPSAKPLQLAQFAEDVRPGQHVALFGFVATVTETRGGFGRDTLHLTVQRPLDGESHYVFPTLSFARREHIEVLAPAEYIEREKAYRANPQWPSEDMRQAYRDRLVQKRPYQFEYDALLTTSNTNLSEWPTTLESLREAMKQIEALSPAREPLFRDVGEQTKKELERLYLGSSLTAQRDVKAGQAVTTKDVSGPVSADVGPCVLTAPGKLQRLVGAQTIAEAIAAKNEPATVQELPGVSSVDTGPGWARVVLKHGASADEEKVVNDWLAQRATPDFMVLVYREAKPVEALVVTTFAPGAPTATIETHVIRGVPGARHERLDGGLATTPASPRWWKGETAPKPERMGRRR